MDFVEKNNNIGSMQNTYVVITDPMDWCFIAPHQLCLYRLWEAPENKVQTNYPKKVCQKQHSWLKPITILSFGIKFFNKFISKRLQDNF